MNEKYDVTCIDLEELDSFIYACRFFDVDIPGFVQDKKMFKKVLESRKDVRELMEELQRRVYKLDIKEPEWFNKDKYIELKVKVSKIDREVLILKFKLVEAIEKKEILRLKKEISVKEKEKKELKNILKPYEEVASRIGVYRILKNSGFSFTK